MSAGSVSASQIRFLWLLDPIKRWPALPVQRLSKFDGFGHQSKPPAEVVAFDSAPLVVLKNTSVDADHAVDLAGWVKGCAAGNQWRAKNRNPRRALQRASSPGGASSFEERVAVENA